MKTGEARLAVKDIIGSADVAEAARAYAFTPHEAVNLDQSTGQGMVESANVASELDRLKTAEYALLAGPVTRGVEQFLDQPRAMFMPTEKYGMEQIAERVGTHVFRNAWALLQDEGVRELAAELADLRASKVTSPQYATLISPFQTTLRAAALSSARNTENTVAANAFTIQRSVGHSLTHEEQVAATRASHHLALAHPTVHIGDMGIVSLIVQDYNNTTFIGDEFRESILKFEPGTQKVVLEKGLLEWSVGPTRTIGDTAAKNEDVRVGCPFSFAPRDVRVGYYEAMVDIIDENGVWPQLLRNIVSADGEL